MRSIIIIIIITLTVHLRHQGCKYPETCYCSAENLLTSLSLRFDPYDDLTPTPNPTELDKSKLCQYVIRNPDEVLIFNFPKQLPHDTQNHLRVFGPPENHIDHPDITFPSLLGDIVAYTDSSCLDNGDAKAKARSGIWFNHNNPWNIGLPVHSSLPQSNNVTEMLAIYHTAKKIASWPQTPH